jgi:hypothetical protein
VFMNKKIWDMDKHRGLLRKTRVFTRPRIAPLDFSTREPLYSLPINMLDVPGNEILLNFGLCWSFYFSGCQSTAGFQHQAATLFSANQYAGCSWPLDTLELRPLLVFLFFRLPINCWISAPSSHFILCQSICWMFLATRYSCTSAFVGLFLKARQRVEKNSNMSAFSVA